MPYLWGEKYIRKKVHAGDELQPQFLGSMLGVKEGILVGGAGKCLLLSHSGESCHASVLESFTVAVLCHF